MNSLSKGCTSFRDLGVLGLIFRGPSRGLRSYISRLQAAMRVRKRVSVNRERLLLIAVNRERKNLFLVIREQK